ncbi:MAG: GNAT family N-acetyltransferase [Rhodothermales bacterium]
MRWADIDAQSVLPTPFSDERFVAGLAAVFGWSVRRVDTTVGLSALLVERRTGPFREIVLPPFAPWTALALDTNPGEPLPNTGLQELCEMLRNVGIPALLSLPASWPQPLPALPGWTVRERDTAVLTTGTLETVLSGYSSSSRRTFRKHADEYVCAETSRSPSVESDVRATIDLLANAYGRHGRTLPGGSPARMADLALLMLKVGRARMYTARRQSDNGIAAGIVVLHRGSTAWYWLSGSVPGPAMSVLVGTAAADLAEQGIRNFDLMGANTPSIAEFKRRLGAERVTYAHLILPGNGMPALLAAARRTVGRFRGAS